MHGRKVWAVSGAILLLAVVAGAVVSQVLAADGVLFQM